jgi:uncharacterized NAD-dependent epimerase/dehydratase family protein
MNRKVVILTEGYTNPHTAKTASCMIRYRPDEVVALLDSTQAGASTQSLLGVGGKLPVVASLGDAPEANTLLLGIAPPGGKIPPSWRAVVLQAISRGMDVISGLHDFLSDDPEFANAARSAQVELRDVRKNQQREIARRVGLRNECLRIHTVGHDCSVGKMVTSFEITQGLKRRGRDAKFIATGQTGILVEGDGCPVDCVVADFVSGAVERMILENQHHEILVIEGQGSLIHPSYSGVTLGLLHGCDPHGLIMCYEVGRETITGVEHVRIPPLPVIRQLNETMAGIFHPCPVIAVAMNSRRVTAEQAEAERERVRGELGLPVCDIFRHGSDELIDAVLHLEEQVREKRLTD